MKLYIYKDRIYHECKYLNSIGPFYSFEYGIRSGEAKCLYCDFTAPGFLFISKMNLEKKTYSSYSCTGLPKGGKWLEL